MWIGWEVSVLGFIRYHSWRVFTSTLYLKFHDRRYAQLLVVLSFPILKTQATNDKFSLYKNKTTKALRFVCGLFEFLRFYLLIAKLKAHKDWIKQKTKCWANHNDKFHIQNHLYLVKLILCQFVLESLHGILSWRSKIVYY